MTDSQHVPEEVKLAWAENQTGKERNEVEVQGRTWYRDDHPAVQVKRQYFYFNSQCPHTKDHWRNFYHNKEWVPVRGTSAKCTCWCDEGTGPRAGARHGDGNTLTWRSK